MPRRSGSRNAVEKIIDRIEDITPTERIVLRALASFGDWTTGENCRPKMTTLARITGLSRRALQYALRSLCCPSAAECERSATDAHPCRHRGYVTMAAAAARYQPAVYTVLVERLLPVQSHLPERARWSGADVPGATDPFAQVVLSPDKVDELIARPRAG